VRLVFDTNVLVAATLSSRGRCGELVEYCSLEHELISSDALIAELHDKLLRKFRFPPERAAERVAVFVAHSRIVMPRPLPSPVCRDPDDDIVLATAVAGTCACIVTGDKDLLVLREYAGIRIISPREFPQFEATHVP
jgi:putative PIN family toxin of toxin-antitoxin system